MPVRSAFDRIGGQIAFAHGPRYPDSGVVHDPYGFSANLRDVAFLQEQEPPGHGQQCRHIGSDEIFIDAEADNHRATRAREHDALGIGL